MSDDVDLIDQRIRRALASFRRQGTLVSRESTGPGATVRFDGATVATPAKVFGGVFAQPGDRVALDLYGSDWCVSASFAASSFGESSAGFEGLPTQTGNLTSGSYVDLTEFGTVPISKFFDLTYLQFTVTVGCYTTSATTSVGTRVLFAVRLTPLPGTTYTPVDLPVGGMTFNAASTHQSYTREARIINVPSGNYTASLRWRRASGNGALIADSNDTFHLGYSEQIRQASPIL